MVALGPVLVPVRHGVHVRSDVAVPAMSTMVLSGQLLQAVQVVAPVIAL